MKHNPSDWEETDVDLAYQHFTGSHPSIKSNGCGCMPFITIVLVGLILLFLLIAAAAILLE
jgi:hypothetical protein